MSPAEQIESLLAELAQDIATTTGEHRYAVVSVEVNVNGSVEWRSYTPSMGWNAGKTWAETRDKSISRVQVAEKLRREAADLLAKAAALENTLNA